MVSKRQLDYWTRREREHEAELKASQDKAVETIVKQLNAERVEIMNLIAAFWGRYAGQNGITRAETYKLAAKMDVEDFAAKAAEYVKNKDFGKKANAELKLYNLKMKVSRYELLLNQINLELAKLADANIQKTLTFLKAKAVEEYERQAGILGPSAKLSKAQIDGLVVDNHANTTFMDRWYNQGQDIGVDLDKVIRSAIIGGKHPMDFVDRIAKRFKVAAWEAQRLLITETAFVQTKVQQSSFRRAGFEEGMLIAESNACSICLSLSGKPFKLADLKSGSNAPPLHPNCRCSIVPVMDDKDWENSLVRRGIKSRNELKKDEEDFKAELAKARAHKKSFKDDRDDREEFTKYAKLIKDDRTKSVSNFKDIKYNKPEEWQRLQDNYYVREKLKSGEWKDEINPEKQAKHTDRRTGKSHFDQSFDLEKLKELYDGNKGTGILVRDRNGKRTSREQVKLDIPVAKLDDGKEAFGITIHYGKTGAHLVPWKG